MKKALLPLSLMLAALMLLAGPVGAQERGVLGYGRIFNNDAMGDGHDRWRTGSYTVSAVRAYTWDGALPERFGDIIEYRLNAEIIAPASLTSKTKLDRRYVGKLSFGAHTHWAMGRAEMSLGADLVVTGPQTGISGFQSWVHSMLDLPKPSAQSRQIGNAVYPTLVGEIGRSFNLGDNVTVRPYVGAQAGVETLVRVGGDVVIGRIGQRDLMLRDGTTGQRYRGIHGEDVTGYAFSFGGDVARMIDSFYLPSDGGATMSDTRSRLRAGITWQGERMGMFYGVTWLSKEFDQQPESQLVGSLRLNLKF